MLISSYATSFFLLFFKYAFRHRVKLTTNPEINTIRIVVISRFQLLNLFVFFVTYIFSKATEIDLSVKGF